MALDKRRKRARPSSRDNRLIAKSSFLSALNIVFLKPFPELIYVYDYFISPYLSKKILIGKINIDLQAELSYVLPTMKMIYVTDIHGDFEKLKHLLSETVADVYVIAGNLIDIPFYNMETSIRYYICRKKVPTNCKFCQTRCGRPCRTLCQAP